MKECFLVEEGVERKAELEDILALIDDTRIHYIFRDALRSNIDQPYALAHIADEVKDKVHRNLPLRIRQIIEKEVKAMESKYAKEDSFIEFKREKLISLIWENRNWIWPYKDLDRVVWKEAGPKEKPNPIEELQDKIEKAFTSQVFDLWSTTNKISKDDLQNVLDAFQGRKNELQRIRTLKIRVEVLPAAATLFEAGGIDNLMLYGEFAGTWPEFLEKCRSLTSINFGVYEGLTEFPLWVRNAASLRCLYFDRSDFAFIPDWIGDMQSLTKLDIGYCNYNLKTLPDSIGNLKNLAKLNINGPAIKKLPESIGNLLSLKELTLYRNKSLTSLPDSIGNLKNLAKFTIQYSAIEKLPDSIGNLFSLNELILDNNEHLMSLPENIGDLKNLAEFSLLYSPIKVLPDWIGNMNNLLELSLENCKNLKCLPDSIGKLKKLTTLNFLGSAIEKLPDTIANCSSLECVDIRATGISSFPVFISSVKTLRQTIEVIPKKRSISYRSFCNSYYTLVETIRQFQDKTRREGLLALEKERESTSDSFLRFGITLVFLKGACEGVTRYLLTPEIEREHDLYKKKLMEIAMEGILCIQCGISIQNTCIKLASMVSIKNNPLDAAFAKYLAGDYNAFDKIDFKAAILPEKESEEIRFIKRACEIGEIYCRYGLIEIEKRLDNDGIAARDIFEYGLCLLVECWNYEEIDKILTILISYETDSARKNLAMAKKEAVRMIYYYKAFHERDNPGVFKQALLAYFDDNVAENGSINAESRNETESAANGG